MTTCLSLLLAPPSLPPPPPPPDAFDGLARGTTVPGEIAARARLYHQLFLMAAPWQRDEQSAVFHAALLASPDEKPRLEWAPQWARGFLPHMGNDVNVATVQGRLLLWYGRKLGLQQSDIDVVDRYEVAHGRVDGMLVAVAAGCFYRALPGRFHSRPLAQVFGVDYEREFLKALDVLPALVEEEASPYTTPTSSPMKTLFKLNC